MRLLEQIQKVGIENCIFLVPMRPVNVYFGILALTSSSDPEIIVPAKICEKRYKLSDKYKITLKSIYERFGTEHFYISDLEQMIKDGTIKFYVSTDENKEFYSSNVNVPISVISNILKYCEDKQIYDKLGNYEDFYYKLNNLVN